MLVICDCDLPVRIHRETTGENAGKRYIGCNHPPDHPTRCNMKVYLHDPMPVQANLRLNHQVDIPSEQHEGTMEVAERIFNLENRLLWYGGLLIVTVLLFVSVLFILTLMKLHDCFRSVVSP